MHDLTRTKTPLASHFPFLTMSMCFAKKVVFRGVRVLSPRCQCVERIRRMLECVGTRCKLLEGIGKCLSVLKDLRSCWKELEGI